MAIVGDVSASEIQAEFGGTNPISASEYYRNAGLVPDHANTATIPTAGEIAYGDFVNTDVDDSLAVFWADISNSRVDAYNAGSVTITAQASASTTGGEAPPVYSWAYISGSAAITINNSGNITNPIFSYTANILHGDSSTVVAIWEVTANDGITVSKLQRTITLTISKIKQAVSILWSAGLATSDVSYGSTNSVNLNRTVSVTGGRGPFLYLWEYVSGTSFVLSNTSTPTANFAYTQNLTGPADTGIVYGTYKVTITDTFDGEVDVLQISNGVGLRLIEQRFLGTIGITANSVINSKTDVFGTAGNNVSVTGGTSGSHAAGYSISSYAWSRTSALLFIPSGITTNTPSWTYTNDISGPFDTGYVSETWQLIVTDQYGLTQTSSCSIQLRLIELAGAPPNVNAGVDRTGSATTNYGSTNTTAVTALATISAGDHPISSINWSYRSGTSFTIINSTSEDATFSRTENLVGPASWPLRQGVYRLTVTDNVGQEIWDEVVITLQHTETITGSTLPDAYAGANTTASNSGPANTGAITVQYEITDATVSTGTYSLHSSPIYWELVTFSNVAFTIDVPLNTWLSNTVANRTPLFSRSEDLAPGASTSHNATYRMRVRDVQGQLSPIDSGSDVVITLNISENHDTVPNAFSFIDQTDTALASTITSNIITISGISTAVAVVLSGTAGSKQMSINGGSWVTTGSISNGQTLRVRATSAATKNTETTLIVTIGGISDTFSITTENTLSVVVSPTSIDESFLVSSELPGDATVTTTASLTAIPSGGTPGYTYYWSGTTGGMIIVSSSSSSTKLSLTTSRPAAGVTNVINALLSTLTVTDTVNDTAIINNIPVTFRITGV